MQKNVLKLPVSFASSDPDQWWANFSLAKNLISPAVKDLTIGSNIVLGIKLHLGRVNFEDHLASLILNNVIQKPLPGSLWHV